MPQEEVRRRKKPRLYDVLVVPIGEVSPTRTIRTSRLRLIFLGLFVFLACVAITLAALVYTPVAMYVPIPNPALEQRYGRQIVNLQERLNSLAEDVLLLRDYNVQLRKALGEDTPRDSVVRRQKPLIADDATPVRQHEYSAPRHEADEEGDAQILDEGSDAPLQGSRDAALAIEATHPAFPLLIPTEGIATQGFNPSRGHFGVDIAARQGTPIFAATDGTVVFSGWTYDDGNMLLISHGDGYMTVYKHAQALLKTFRTTVKRGEPVALVGSTGKTSQGPHLHFEVWKDGTPLDPDELLLTPIRMQ